MLELCLHDIVHSSSVSHYVRWTSVTTAGGVARDRQISCVRGLQPLSIAYRKDI